MEITILSEEENPMLHRTDVRFRVSHVEASPERLAVRDSLAARLNKSADEVVIRRLDTKFGMRETIGEAKVYEAAAHAKDVEQGYMLARNKIGVEDGEVEEAAAEPEPEAAEEPEPATEPEEAAEDEAEPDAEVEAEEGADEPEEAAEDEADSDAEAEAADEEDAEPDEAEAEEAD